MIPSGKDIFVNKVPVEVEKMTHRERELYIKRKYYWEHRDTLLQEVKANYRKKRDAFLAAGGEEKKRGRPRKSVIPDTEPIVIRKRTLATKDTPAV